MFGHNLTHRPYKRELPGSYLESSRKGCSGLQSVISTHTYFKHQWLEKYTYFLFPSHLSPCPRIQHYTNMRSILLLHSRFLCDVSMQPECIMYIYHELSVMLSAHCITTVNQYCRDSIHLQQRQREGECYWQLEDRYDQNLPCEKNFQQLMRKTVLLYLKKKNLCYLCYKNSDAACQKKQCAWFVCWLMGPTG